MQHQHQHVLHGSTAQRLGLPFAGPLESMTIPIYTASSPECTCYQQASPEPWMKQVAKELENAEQSRVRANVWQRLWKVCLTRIGGVSTAGLFVRSTPVIERLVRFSAFLSLMSARPRRPTLPPPTKQNKSDTACRFHTAPPIFHDTRKGWSCCEKRVYDWDEFEQLEGELGSSHSPTAELLDRLFGRGRLRRLCNERMVGRVGLHAGHLSTVSRLEGSAAVVSASIYLFCVRELLTTGRGGIGCTACWSRAPMVAFETSRRDPCKLDSSGSNGVETPLMVFDWWRLSCCTARAKSYYYPLRRKCLTLPRLSCMFDSCLHRLSGGTPLYGWSQGSLAADTARRRAGGRGKSE